MTNPDELSREEIDARLDELDQQKQAVREFRDHVNEARDALGAIQNYEFVEEETATKFDLLGTMLDWVAHHDVEVEYAIQYEREQLKRRRLEIKHEAGGLDE